METPHAIKLIVGLGNPGPDYEKTRHNAGAWFVEELCKQENISLKNEKQFQARWGTINIAGKEVRLLLSNTYMNHSGQAVKAISKYFNIPLDAILVAHDDLDLPPGIIRFKTDGGHGGHNGLRDIIEHFGQRNFHRLRIGIGHPGHKDKVLDFVLHKPSKQEEMYIREAIQEAVSVFPKMIEGKWELVKNRLHTFNAKPEQRTPE